MRATLWLFRILLGLLWIVALVALAAAYFFNGPYFSASRENVWIVILIAAALGITVSFAAWWKTKPRAVRVLILLWIAVPLTLGAVKWQARQQVADVLNTPRELAQLYGRHLIVGYWHADDVRELAHRGLIGGLYITRRNIAQGYAALKQEIAELQALRKAAGLPPLIVTADQEGGLVSQLSPPLTAFQALASFAQAAPVEGLARKQGKEMGAELAALGVTLNFAPVVDLKSSRGVALLDLYSQIERRAISSDLDAVTKVGVAFIEGMREAGVGATLKHFPGLGRVVEDTHWFQAHLTAEREELDKSDWKPFRDVLARTDAAVMVAHVIADAIDATRPASQSKAVIDGVLRKQWGFDGLTITDDLNMGAVYHRDLCSGVVASLNAGIDLLLVSYDGRQYYPIMSCVLAAHRDGRIDRAMLDASERRLRARVR